MEEAQTQQFEEQSGMAIFGQRVQEGAAESSFRASVAGRGLRFEGSPLAQLAGQKNMAEKQIGLEERQRTATAAGLRLQSNIQYGTYLYNKSIDIYNYNQGQADIWINAFTNTLNFASSYLGKIWNPAQPASAMGGGGGNSSAFMRPY
jgi:hypothetical protein